MTIHKQILRGFAVVSLAALLAGCESGPQVRSELPASQNASAVAAKSEKPAAPALPKGSSVITTDEMKSLVAKGPVAGNYLMFDSRPAARFHAATIPTSLMLPVAEMDKTDKEGKVHPLLGEDKNRLLVFWCGGPTCPFSLKAAQLAVKYGYTNVKVYSGGDPAWAKAEQPFVSSPKFVEEGNILLIDIRPPASYASGHIPRALNLPLAAMGKYRESDFPSFKGAPFVLYSDNMAELNKAFELLRDFGFSKATYFAGGTAKWQQMGKKLVVGAEAIPEKLTFVRKLASHDITIPDFIRELDNPAVTILDVRAPSERSGGSFKGALHIPFEDISTRFAEIPKDRPVIIHCATGIRSSIAYETLKAKGYSNLKVLNANVIFEAAQYKITE